VAALVRSIGPDGLRLPHTGALQYTNDAPKIPAAAISSLVIGFNFLATGLQELERDV